MRKGRSSRRSKSSRPPRAADAARSPKSAEAVVGTTGPGPRVVVGIARPSDPPAPAPDPRRDAPAAALEIAETRGGASGEAVRGLDVATATLELAAREAPRAEPEAVDGAGEAAQGGAATERAGETTEGAARDAAGAADEAGSIPPVGDVVVEEFFSEGDVGRHLAGELEPEEALIDHAMARKRAPHVVARRTRFARYVTWAVGVAAVVCVAAAIRGWVAPHGAAVEAAGAANAVVAFEDPPVPKDAPPEPAAAAPGPRAVTAETAAAAPTTEPPRPDALAAGAPADDAVKTQPEVPRDAAAEKLAARRALESGKVGAAIEAGERSVALDPTDGEAWLLLGAAYQEKGKAADARRCYTACLKQGKRGPLGECAAMLQ